MYQPSSRKKKCWNLIGDYLKSHQMDNIVLTGNINITLSLGEKRGGSIVKDPLQEWVEYLIIEWDLEDIKPSEGKVTWINKRAGPEHIAARL